jgi:uncharacterized membrane protein
MKLLRNMSLFGALAAIGALALAQTTAEPQGTGVRATFRLLDMPAPWIVVLILLPLCALVAWIGYGREAIAARARAILAGLRFAALLLILFVIFRPVFVERREEIKPAEVLLLIDDSASMRRIDAYGGNDSVREELRSIAGRSPSEISRQELARAAVERELVPLLREGEYVTRTFRFADTLEPLADLSNLSARGHATYIGDALQQALAAHRGRHVTDVVIVSDGRNNGGLAPLEAARAAGAGGIPVHTLVVGDTRPERNALVELVEVPPSVLDGDEIAITVRVVGRGTQGVERTRVLLEELGADDGDPARPLAEEETDLDEAGTRVVLVAPPGTPDLRTNERRFRVSVPPLTDETMRDDNAIEFGVHVTPEKIRVLFVDGYPRWEYRFLMELLKRADANIEAQIFLLSATSDFIQESSRNVPALSEVPTDRKELLERYDVVILGDVNPYEISPDPARCDEFMASLREFVERGGGLIFIAGESDAPRSFVNTPLEELLPVVVDGALARSLEGASKDLFRPTVEEPTSPHEIVRLVSDPAENRGLWEEPGGFYGLFWFYPIVRAKPGAQVLLRHPSASNAHGRYPLLVGSYFPAGRTLFQSFDESWRWRFRFADRYHERYWRNAIRWVALGRLKSGDRRVQIDALKSSFNLDERITLEARVLDEDYRPSEKAAVDAKLLHPDGTTTELKLVLVTDRPGLYRASFELDRPGLYTAFVETDGARVASSEFEVVLPSRENTDPSPDPETLGAIAKLTGGRALPLAKVRALESEFPGQEEHREPISSELDDAWDNWATLLVALFLLSTEWVLRKRWELV